MHITDLILLIDSITKLVIAIYQCPLLLQLVLVFGATSKLCTKIDIIHKLLSKLKI